MAYFPFDQPDIMERAARSVQPRVTVLLESEIWPSLFAAPKRNGSKILIINGRMAKKSLARYLLWPALWHALSPDRVPAVSQTDAERSATLFGRNCLDVMGNMKLDRIGKIESVGYGENPVEKVLSPGLSFVVVGSVRSEEEGQVEKIVVDVLRRVPRTVIGLFPRHLHRNRHWEKALDRLDVSWVLRSKAEQRVPQGTVILWDTFGELSIAYTLAQAAFVGGSLAPLGGQNFLEAGLSGLVPVIGPTWYHFSWAGQELLDRGLVRRAAGWQEVADLLVRDLRGTKSPERVREEVLDYVQEHQGGDEEGVPGDYEAPGSNGYRGS
jgi:3-deoxy-D-manno-octulosonic-acid transferase